VLNDVQYRALKLYEAKELKKYTIFLNAIIKKNSVAVVRKGTIPTEQPPLVGEVSANLCA
jgi:hypothetical protein